MHLCKLSTPHHQQRTSHQHQRPTYTGQLWLTCSFNNKPQQFGSFKHCKKFQINKRKSFRFLSPNSVLTCFQETLLTPAFDNQLLRFLVLIQHNKYSITVLVSSSRIDVSSGSGNIVQIQLLLCISNSRQTIIRGANCFLFNLKIQKYIHYSTTAFSLSTNVYCDCFVYFHLYFDE